MTILEFADAMNQELRVIYYPNQESRFSAAFENCDTKDGSMLCGEFGDAKTPMDAIYAYANKIAGKTLVFDAMTPYRKEYVAPKTFDRVDADKSYDTPDLC